MFLSASCHGAGSNGYLCCHLAANIASADRKHQGRPQAPSPTTVVSCSACLHEQDPVQPSHVPPHHELQIKNRWPATECTNRLGGRLIFHHRANASLDIPGFYLAVTCRLARPFPWISPQWSTGTFCPADPPSPVAVRLGATALVLWDYHGMLPKSHVNGTFVFLIKTKRPGHLWRAGGHRNNKPAPPGIDSRTNPKSVSVVATVCSAPTKSTTALLASGKGRAPRSFFTMRSKHSFTFKAQREIELPFET
ncbi:hypothetical protein BaRGS_00007769 [Batillaria attramentaria]|uniref:Uncharacterized protein n=1 Tax=Batillaria attramentaria TaxID=370345 RepID=A0ABD0LPE2_9CAEN